MISLVLPVYNVEDYLVHCLETIADQEYRDFEVILVNDGSQDKSIEYAKEYLKDSEMDWRIIDKENGGLASARNAGLMAAKGDYVAFIDTDDAISRDFLSRLIHVLEDDMDFSFCAFRFVKQQAVPDTEDTVMRIYDQQSLMDAFLKRNIAFVVPSMLFRKRFLLDNDLFFDEKIRFSEDQPFIWNVILHSQKSIYLPKQMYGYHIRENSIMTGSSYEKIINSYREFKEVISRIFADHPEYQRTKELLLPRWELGALYSSARLIDYDQYLKIYEEMDGRSILKRIRGIGEIKAYLLASVCSASPKLLYALCRRMDLNE